MLDGEVHKDSKWYSSVNKNGGDTTFWAIVDLGEVQDISRWVVYHAESGGEGNDVNTRDFKLQYLPEEVTRRTVSGSDSLTVSDTRRKSLTVSGNDVSGGDAMLCMADAEMFAEENWEDADVVSGNRDAITDRNLETPIQAQYVRLEVTKATYNDNNAVRICELELYSEPGIGEIPEYPFRYEQDMKNAEVRAQSRDGFSTVSWLSAKENIIVTEITNVTEAPLGLEISTWTANAHTAAEIYEDTNTMIATKVGLSEKSNLANITGDDGKWPGWRVNIAMASKIIGMDGEDIEVAVENVDNKKNAATFQLQPGQSATLVTAIEGGKEDEDTQINTMDDAISKAVGKLNTRLTQVVLCQEKVQVKSGNFY